MVNIISANNSDRACKSKLVRQRTSPWHIPLSWPYHLVAHTHPLNSSPLNLPPSSPSIPTPQQPSSSPTSPPPSRASSHPLPNNHQKRIHSTVLQTRRPYQDAQGKSAPVVEKKDGLRVGRCGEALRQPEFAHAPGRIYRCGATA
ncbi:uncharacterized protein CC84DRAFT_873838 [Paraphaeosphaeria sporulosa]|uniref:Uncharacterized protein n=1 Tax=Paraphaeosphaeria sporulosa TaxID=1460663 RepID=A0A177C8P1_9PLEO|nr:uncharacterized protein CC84DRAFT_873838 [Paraphaeosphaeria sporulosa]OAG03925.1 hypothetical protein CC84DRAFT_873838 [Paraphaeosphaeria sporulosa]